MDSIRFSRFLEERRTSGRDLCFVIGGPFGLELGGRRPSPVARRDHAAPPARARGAARAALPRPQDPRRRALPLLIGRCPSDRRSSRAARAAQRHTGARSASSSQVALRHPAELLLALDAAGGRRRRRVRARRAACRSASGSSGRSTRSRRRLDRRPQRHRRARSIVVGLELLGIGTLFYGLATVAEFFVSGQLSGAARRAAHSRR